MNDERLPETVEQAAQAAALRSSFSREFFLTVWALSEVLVAGQDGPPPFARLLWLCDDLVDFLTHTGARSRLVFRGALLAVSTLSPLLVWRLPPFRFLSLESRRRGIERMERSLLSLPVLALKAIICIIYYEHPDAAREIGYQPSPQRPGSTP